jgi:Flp pilus assembly protein TadG
MFGRRGTTVVEMAVMAPLFIMAMLGMLELGYAFMIKQTVTLAAREGARAGVLPGATIDDIHTAADASMAPTNFTRYTPPESYDPADVTGYITTSNLETLAPTDVDLYVEIKIPLSIVSLTGSLFANSSNMITSTTHMRREGVDDGS